MKNKLVLTTLRNTILAVIYVFLVSQLLNNGEILFGNASDNFIAPFLMLLLFVVSATIVGSLIFGHAVLLFFKGKRADSVKSAIFSVGWLSLITALFFIVLLVANLSV